MNDSVDDEKSVQVFVERDRKVFLVWNAEDVKRLRTKHRIVGELVGTLPTHKSQNDYLGLPLQLSVEEVSVGCFYGFLELVTWKESPEDVVVSAQEEPKSCTRKRRYSEMEASSDSMESVGASQKLRRVVGTWKDTVANVFQSLLSFWKDWNKNTDHAESLEQTYLEPVSSGRDDADLTSKVTKVPEWNTKQTILVEEPNRKDAYIVLFRKGMPYPDFLPSFGSHSSASRRLTVFHDLWKRGFYLSSGVKFGADFLGYADDPILFHASLAVVVAEEDSNISPRDLVAFGRLGVSTKKRAALAYIRTLKNGGGEDFPSSLYEVVYLCIRWIDSLP
ncbi:hypothetical protein GAYE_SCF63G6665 [Galdieria yellowstonensis]|uniref:tRNA-splicing endonuclease subunit Sen34 n=1 Tax=Galdieria yellowstonensis TaxID=3028027 RepID=A0AAV9IMS0_9RHOD|nr:hypothetical protein GAYE_SCF63G6665 [Galdieria yellowstonensis]